MAITTENLKSVFQILTDAGTTPEGKTKTATQTFSSGIIPTAVSSNQAAEAWVAIAALMDAVLEDDLLFIRGVLTNGYSEV